MSTNYEAWFEERKAWLIFFLTVAFSGHAGLGMALAIFGPTQPYLGRQTGVSVDTVNYIWTARSLGVVLTSLITAFTFRQYCRSTQSKLYFLAASEIITGIFVLSTPFTTSFPLLLLLVTLYGMGLGMFDTCDNSLMVYIFGPQRSRPFTQSVHSFVGAGFVAGILLSKPFLPEQKSPSGDVCPNHNLTEIGIRNDPYISPDDPPKEQENDIIPGIIWPYILVSFWHFLTAIGFLILAFKGSEMPRYMTDTSPIQENTKNTFTNMKYWKSVIVMVFVYYTLTCGLESFFQSMSYTYGICGPLKLSVDTAATLTTVYYTCFMTGRLSGIFVSRYIIPRTLVLTSMISCIVAAIILCIWGQTHAGLFLGTGLLGLGVAVQFPSGLSWTAERIDVTGNLSFIFFTGGYTGFLSCPPIAGKVFTTSEDPLGIFYLTLAFTLALLIHFGLMNFCAKFKVKEEEEYELEQEEEEGWHDIIL